MSVMLWSTLQKQHNITVSAQHSTAPEGTTDIHQSNSPLV
jgi:hypothetical protein